MKTAKVNAYIVHTIYYLERLSFHLYDTQIAIEILKYFNTVSQLVLDHIPKHLSKQPYI